MCSLLRTLVPQEPVNEITAGEFVRELGKIDRSSGLEAFLPNALHIECDLGPPIGVNIQCPPLVNCRMTSDVDKLLEKNDQLNQLDAAKVVSHVQRLTDEWFVNTLMLEGYDVPFRYNRKKKYRDLTGTPVNLTFYREIEQLAGMDFEVMKVVRIRKS